jgi:small subunit ribosomal protein S1
LQPGQIITARIISLDKQRQRMGLSLRHNGAEESGATETPVEETSVES